MEFIGWVDNAGANRGLFWVSDYETLTATFGAAQPLTLKAFGSTLNNLLTANVSA